MLDTRLVILFILLGLAIEAQTFGMPMGGGGGEICCLMTKPAGF